MNGLMSQFSQNMKQPFSTLIIMFLKHQMRLLEVSSGNENGTNNSKQFGFTITRMFSNSYCISKCYCSYSIFDQIN